MDLSIRGVTGTPIDQSQDYLQNSKLPVELLTTIFKIAFQDKISDYHCVSLVCRSWRKAVNDTSINFEMACSFSKMAIVQPSIEVISNSSKENIKVCGITQQFTFIYDSSQEMLLFVDKSDAQINSINLQKSFDKICKDSLIKNRTALLLVIDDQNFVTLMKNGIMALWKISEKSADCMHYVQIYNQDEINFLTENKNQNAYVLKACLINEKILVRSRVKSEGKSLHHVFDLNLNLINIHTECDQCIYLDLSIYNRTDIFNAETNGIKVFSFDENCCLIQKQLSIDISIENRMRKRMMTGKLHSVNDDWVVFESNLVFKQDDINRRYGYVFQIFNAKNGSKALDGGLIYRKPGERLPIKSFLCGNFLLSRRNDQIKIYHIYSKKKIFSWIITKELFGETIDIQIFTNAMQIITHNGEVMKMLKYHTNSPVRTIPDEPGIDEIVTSPIGIIENSMYDTHWLV